MSWDLSNDDVSLTFEALFACWFRWEQTLLAKNGSLNSGDKQKRELYVKTKVKK